MTEPPADELDFAGLLRFIKGDLTYDELARYMPEDPESGMPSPGAARLEQMANKPLKTFPSPDTIRRLAEGAQRLPHGSSITEQMVIDAACVSLGFRVRRHRSRLELFLPAETSDFTEREVNAVLAVANLIAESHRSGSKGRGNPR